MGRKIRRSMGITASVQVALINYLILTHFLVVVLLIILEQVPQSLCLLQNIFYVGNKTLSAIEASSGYTACIDVSKHLPSVAKPPKTLTKKVVAEYSLIFTLADLGAGGFSCLSSGSQYPNEYVFSNSSPLHFTCSTRGVVSSNLSPSSLSPLK